jgi:hypothetical protein
VVLAQGFLWAYSQVAPGSRIISEAASTTCLVPGLRRSSSWQHLRHFSLSLCGLSMSLPGIGDFSLSLTQQLRFQREKASGCYITFPYHYSLESNH